MHIKPFQAVLPKLEYISSADSFFDSIKEAYAEHRERGFFMKFPREALFIYRISGGACSYTGLIACCDIRDYLKGKIRKHESTLADKEQKQIQLFLRRRAEVKPVLLTYPEVPHISDWTKAFLENHEPFMKVFFEKDGQEHSLWELSERRYIREITDLFAGQVPVSYIADGHHRTTSTALLYEQTRAPLLKRRFRKLLCAFFPSTDLAIHDFNRVVEGMNHLSLSSFMDRLAGLFHIEMLDGPRRPFRKHELVMFVHGRWFLLQWKEAVLENYGKDGLILDSRLLNELVLEGILGIVDVRVDHRIEYIEGSQGLEGIWQRVSAKESRIGFCLYPVKLQELIMLADRGQLMPPKTTWFEPRMKNGLVVCEI